MPGYEIAQAGLTVRDVDVLVLGGGMAGCFAAMAARADGASVVLVEPSNALGGQGTAGGVAGFCGDTVRVNGLFAEFVDRLAACGRIDPYNPNDDRRAYDLEVCAFFLQEFVVEKGVDIWLHARAIDARAQGRRVDRVLVSCGATLVEVRPKVVIDATGNAMVPEMLGLETVHLGALKQLPMSLYFTLWDTHRHVRPFLPPGCPEWESDDDLPMTSLHCFADGRVEVKMKVVGFDAADGFSLSQAEIHARRQMMGLVYYLQTRGYRGRHGALAGKALDTHVLASVSRNIGQREGRRIIGRYVISDSDARTALVRDDAVAVGTYHLDFHWTATEKRAGTGITDMVEPYHIPLDAMVPAGADNVLCPGRSISGEQLAMSSYRVMATCAQTGFGAGIAAALAARTDTAVPQVDRTELRRRIVAGGQSLDLADYGDYLRCLRFCDEAVPVCADAARTAESNAPLRSVALGMTRNAAFFAARIAATDPARIDIALRRRAAWTAYATLVCDRPLVALRLSAGPDGRPLLLAAAADGNWGKIEADFPAIEPPYRDSPIRAQFRPTWVAEGDAPSPDFGDAAGLAEFVRLADAHCRMHDGHLVRLAFVHAPAGKAAFDLIAIARNQSGSTLRIARIGADVDPAAEPACLATGVGCAVAYRTRAGGLRFWQGPIERFAEPEAPSPTSAELYGRPYKDHLILSAP